MTNLDVSLREYEYTDRDFDRVRQLIYERVGIALAPTKKEMVYSRLSRRLRALGIDSFSEYLVRLEGPEGTDEWQSFTNALTTNLTSFFREPHHFEILQQHFQRIGKKKSRIRIWSAAASTGEEPYSIAMSAVEFFGGFNAPVSILATDVDTHVLDQGQRGIYPLERIERMPQERLKRFFMRGTGPNEGYCRVSDRLRQMIDFRQLNLLDTAWPIREPFDAIFCRNVMIYFDKPTQLAILKKMMPLLVPDGLFFAGHSESFFHASELIRPLGRTVYAHARAVAASI
jgi:chemotaxis protein methyltransferase CheR